MLLNAFVELNAATANQLIESMYWHANHLFAT